ncbi:MAG: NAD+ synthase [Nitrospirota bacterium]|nr:NAD+ synthase [Nitrospirota bacterium]
MRFLRLALAQINSVVGDIHGNSGKIIDHIKRARRRKADIVVFPELAVTGYPPEDLLLKPRFIADNLAAIERISLQTEGITVITGFVDSHANKGLYNAAAVIAEGRIVDVYHKVFLPNYGVFDEFRYFRAAKRFPVYSLNRTMFGINICEDIWYSNGPAHVQALAGAEVVININASPFESGKPEKRERILAERSNENGVVIAYLNAVGGQDELVFDGFSMVVDQRGGILTRGKQFQEDLMIVDLDLEPVRKLRKKRGPTKTSIPQKMADAVEMVHIPAQKIPDRKPLKRMIIEPLMRKEEEYYRAISLGTSDYVRKNGFSSVVIGLSGGIDSSLVAVIAVDAIGRENVKGLFMPSMYTSVESREDAFQLAENLGIEITEIPIDGIMEGYLEVLEDKFSGIEADITEENLQARIRGNLLMAFSNKFGLLVLTTGNKSEMSVGYATLYGDMAGGFAIIKDVPKTLVYDISRWRNSTTEGPVIPERVLWKEPTAELKPDQKDSDTLPPYPVLDPILKAYVEDDMSFEEIVKVGCDPECTRKVIGMIDRSEYKRRQSPPGIKITPRAFGRDRRFPITNRYRSY